MTLVPLVRTLVIATTSALLVTAFAVGPTPADTLVASDTDQQGSLVAASEASRPRSGPRAAASIPRGIVVSDHGGKPVALFAEGESPLRRSRPGKAPVTFTGLTPGRAYTVIVGGTSLGKVTAIDKPAAATSLRVHATDATGVVSLTWRYRSLASTGGPKVTFAIAASSPGAPPITARVADVRRASLSGLNPAVLYSFDVTPINSAGRGRPTTARMTRTLAQLTGASADPAPPAATPSPTPTPMPTPTASGAPAVPPPPTTRTILVCPPDYTENADGTCTRTIAYTFHQEPSGPAPLLVSYETTDAACPLGYNLEVYGWVSYCRLYGPVPTRSVKDPTPTGYTDNGTAWVRTVPKIAVVVPA